MNVRLHAECKWRLTWSPKRVDSTNQSARTLWRFPGSPVVARDSEVAFNISVLPKYRVICYDYTVKCCSLINCNWCVWLDIVYILALFIYLLVI